MKHWRKLSRTMDTVLITLHIIIGQSGSQYHPTSCALAQICKEYGPASIVMSKLHKYSVLAFQKILGILSSPMLHVVCFLIGLAESLPVMYGAMHT